MRSHLYTEEMGMARNGSLFQKVYPNQGEQQLQSLPQIQVLQDNFTLLTTVVYSILAIQAFPGKDLISNGLGNIFHKTLGPSQLDRRLMFCLKAGKAKIINARMQLTRSER